MADWLTPAEIAAASLGEVPQSVRGLNRVILRDGWGSDAAKVRKAARRGGGFEYHVSLLPGAMRARLSLADSPLSDAQERVCLPHEGGDSAARWSRFEGLPERHKQEAGKRLAVLARAEVLALGGMAGTVSVKAAAAESGVAAASLYNWRALVKGLGRCDWLAALAPSFAGKAAGQARRAACEDQAYQMVKSDFLRPSGPKLSVCIERVREVAEREGWAMPSDRSLRRHIEMDVPREVQLVARAGQDAVKALYAAQTRTKMHFYAMRGVNMDGHKLDVFVKVPDGNSTRVTRVHLVGVQDLYSGKILAWRLSETENKETVRLVIGDMVTAFGIPDAIWLDNGRAFASHWISGGAKNRYRFKVKDEHPKGLLLELGLRDQDIHFTNPYSGQSKPIERAWLDLAELISKHPACEGAYTGNKVDAKPENYGTKAVPLETFRAHVAREIIRHNAREGRRSETCKGRSFDQTFDASLADIVVGPRTPTSAQAALWLLAAEQMRAQKGNGEIHFMGNRYWHEALTGHAGKNVTLRFDPDNLKAELRVYTGRGELICMARCIDKTGFDDQDAARAHGRNRRAYVNAVKATRDLHVRLSAEELARIYAGGAGEAPAAQERQRSKVTRLALLRSSGASQGEEPHTDSQWDEEAVADFSRGLRIVGGSAA
jgi:putative transposase